jgi:hypothetical protein
MWQSRWCALNEPHDMTTVRQMTGPVAADRIDFDACRNG